MTTADKMKYRNWGVGIAIAVFIVFIWPHTSQWSGDGEVSIFVSSNGAKNYRVPAEMEVTSNSNGLIHKFTEYIINNVTWPNGGHSYFDSCTVKDDNKAYCIADNGTEYYVQVNSSPEAPASDSSSDY